jgi:hypothetical protein
MSLKFQAPLKKEDPFNSNGFFFSAKEKAEEICKQMLIKLGCGFWRRGEASTAGIATFGCVASRDTVSLAM